MITIRNKITKKAQSVIYLILGIFLIFGISIIVLYSCLPPISTGPDRLTRRKDNLRHLYQACIIHISNNNYILPEKLDNIFTNEFKKLLFNPLNNNTNIIFYRLMIAGKLNDYDKQTNTVMLTEVEPDKNGKQLVIYVNGRIDWKR